MTGTVSAPRLQLAGSNLVTALLNARGRDGVWEGTLSSSALATSTAVVALALARRDGLEAKEDGELIAGGLRWLAEHQNADGGWGDTDRSASNISTTALAWAALAFADPADEACRDADRAAVRLLGAAGGTDPAALARAIAARYGKDRTFSVPILTTCALAGRLGTPRQAWRLVPQLPFELAAIPRGLYALARLPVVSYALPALISMGLVRHRRRPTLNLVHRAVRAAVTWRVLRVLDDVQPPNGGFLEATPLTSFVALSLIGAGRGRDVVTTRALRFIRCSSREDGSWPIDTNLATWVTTLSVQALAAGGRLEDLLTVGERGRIAEWLLSQQTRGVHRYTGAAPGGWAWTDLPGGVPDADDTPGALLALRHVGNTGETRAAAARGVQWLLDLQNRDGGMPTFCRGWGTLPFDRSGADLTAHAVRAWLAWREDLDASLRTQVDAAVVRALAHIAAVQREDGSFVPLWFGNQHAPEEENPTYGTSRVLLALCDAAAAGRDAVRDTAGRAAEWLLKVQNTDGGWGGSARVASTVEETSLAVSALTAWTGMAPAERAGARAWTAAQRGGGWLAARVLGKTIDDPAPIGLYFAKLWYYERLYPLIFATEALERVEARSRA